MTSSFPGAAQRLSPLATIPADPTAHRLLAGQSLRGRVIKRTGDILFSLLVLGLGAPVFLVLAVVVKPVAML